MAKSTVVNEYIVKITPKLDIDKYNKVMGNLQKRINRTFKNKEPNKKDTLQNAAKTLNSIKSASSGISKIIGSVPGKIGLIIAAAKTLYDIFKKLTDTATQFSNKMISVNSAFVDKNTRNIMARFGVSGQQATGIQSTLGVMGLGVEDLKTMTPGQMQLFQRLMNQWTQGMRSIDPQRIEKFNQVMQNFQSELASAKLELQIQLYQMLVDLSPSLEKLFRSVVSWVKSISDFLTSPMMTKLLDFTARVLSFFADLGVLISDIFTHNWSKLGEDVRNIMSNNANAGSRVTNITNTITNNSTFLGSNDTMFDLATNVNTQNNQTLTNAQLRTGRT